MRLTNLIVAKLRLRSFRDNSVRVMTEFVLNFDDEHSTGFLIKFGKARYLNDIRNGKLRFGSLAYYREFDSKNINIKSNIGDENEGVACIHRRNENTEFEFQHQLLGNSPRNITNSVESFKDFPNYSKYIASFSYFTKSDILNQSIFSKKILENPDWDSVLFIIDSASFLENIQEACKNCNLRYGKVEYADYENQILNADEFNKSNNYAFQKEFRFSIDLAGKDTDCFKQIQFLTIQFEKVPSVIIPIHEFLESFIVEKK